MADNSEDAEEGTSRLGGRSGCFLFLLFVLSQILFIVGFIVNTRVLIGAGICLFLWFTLPFLMIYIKRRKGGQQTTSNTDSIPSPDHSPHRPVVERHNPLHYITIIQGRRPSGRINDAFVGQADGSPTKRDDHVICQPPPYEEIGLSTIQPPSYEEATKAV